MADADKLRSYEPRNLPRIDSEDFNRYLFDELRRVSASFKASQEVIKALEARLVTGGL